jgi:hypothetical protein
MLPNDLQNLYLETQSRLYEVARKMRSMGDEIGGFTGSSDPTNIRTLCSEVSMIGWNSLFAATMMEEILRKSTRRSEVPSDPRLQQLACHLDSLYSGTNYLEKSIQQLKEQMEQLPAEQIDAFSEMLIEFRMRLKEVSDGCQ